MYNFEVFFYSYIILNNQKKMSSPLKIVDNQQKQLPCNIEAEQALIGSILVSNDIYDEVSLLIDSQSISRVHALINNHKGVTFIQDMNSSNGTSINGKKIVPFVETILKEEDLLTLGDVVLNVSN